VVKVTQEEALILRSECGADIDRFLFTLPFGPSIYTGPLCDNLSFTRCTLMVEVNSLTQQNVYELYLVVGSFSNVMSALSYTLRSVFVLLCFPCQLKVLIWQLSDLQPFTKLVAEVTAVSVWWKECYCHVALAELTRYVPSHILSYKVVIST